MYISIALELPRLVSDEWRQVVTWALAVGAERRLQCGDVEYRAPSATKPDVRFMCLPDVGTTLAVGCALWYPRTCVVSVDLDPRLEPMLTRVHLRILMILDVHQHGSRIAEASFRRVETSCDIGLDGLSSRRRKQST